MHTWLHSRGHTHWHVQHTGMYSKPACTCVLMCTHTLMWMRIFMYMCIFVYTAKRNQLVPTLAGFKCCEEEFPMIPSYLGVAINFKRLNHTATCCIWLWGLPHRSPEQEPPSSLSWPIFKYEDALARFKCWEQEIPMIPSYLGVASTVQAS